MGTPLVIDNKKLADLRAFAQAHPIAIAEMRKIVAGKARIIGDRQGHSLNLDFGYRVVFSIEEHPLRDGTGTMWIRHMSMSQARPGRSPNPTAMELVGKELGFPPINECVMELEGEAVVIIAEAKDVRMSNEQPDHSGS